jgi:hypothetical protein
MYRAPLRESPLEEPFLGEVYAPTAARELTAGRRLVASPYLVALLTLLVYGAWLGYQMHSGRDARSFINIGRGFLLQSNASRSISSINQGAPFVERAWGNDGQSMYFIAVDPVNARYYVDGPDYRYRKILYPLLARLLALGNMNLIPLMMILINWFAIAGGTLALASWLKLKHLSPWWALVFGLYPGLSLGLDWDLTEPMSYALAALAVYLYARGGRMQRFVSPVAFALAARTRDKAVLFGLLYGAGLLFTGLERQTIKTWPRTVLANRRHANIYCRGTYDAVLSPYL